MKTNSKWALRMFLTMTTFLTLQSSSRAVVVAVIDTGLDTSHPALKKQLWINQGETGLDKNGRNKANNGIDDDHNGYVDDLHGWNFIKNSNDISDQHGHGTHVAGLIVGATSSQDRANPQTQLMILKYYDPDSDPELNLLNTIRAIRYATHMKAQIINYSGGGFGFNQSELRAIEVAEKKGILFVAAAGNEKSNSDDLQYYPAGYNLPNIISVAAVQKSGQLMHSSNFGIKSVDLAALGEKVLSTVPGGGWGTMSGTSQAAAQVTHAAVQLILQSPHEKPSYSRLIQKLIKSGRQDKQLADKTVYQIRI